MEARQQLTQPTPATTQPTTPGVSIVTQVSAAASATQRPITPQITTKTITSTGNTLQRTGTSQNVSGAPQKYVIVTQRSQGPPTIAKPQLIHNQLDDLSHLE